MDQPGADVVEQLFQKARDPNTSVLVSVINWGEVYYNIAKREGVKGAREFMREVRLVPLAVIEADMAITETAAQLKAGYGLP